MSLNDFFELGAIITGAIFGILGTVTETKDETKRLTKWGMIAVVGIVLVNLFSFINTFIKKREGDLAEIKRLKTDSLHLAHQDSVNKKQIHLQDSVIVMSNKLAQNELALLNKSESVLDRLDSNLDINRSIHKSSIKINNTVRKNLSIQHQLFDTMSLFSSRANNLVQKQEILLARNIEIDLRVKKSLNPLFPFSISYGIELTPPMDRDSLKTNVYYLYKTAFQRLIKTINNNNHIGNDRLNTKIGLERYTKEKQVYYWVSNAYIYQKDFKFLEKLRPTFTIQTYSQLKPPLTPINVGYMGQENELIMRANPHYKYPINKLLTDEDYDERHYNLNGIDISYNQTRDVLSVNFYVTDITVLQDQGNISSTLDLTDKKATLYFQFPDLPSRGQVKSFDFYFEPNFSRRLSAWPKKQNTWTEKKGFLITYRDTLDFMYNRLP